MMSNSRSYSRDHVSRRVVFFGRRCRLSAEPLQALLEADIDIVAVVIPARTIPGRPTTPVRRVPPRARGHRPRMAGTVDIATVDDLVDTARVPLLEFGGLRHRDVAAVLQSLSPAVFAVSCFPWRIPSTLLRLPEIAALNAHPSLLPRHRGPDPLFWTYYGFESQSGVTIHQMTGQLDAGDVVLQEPLDVPAGQPGDVLEARCSVLAAQILAQATCAALNGTMRPHAQDPREVTYEGWPEPRSLRLDPSWTPEQAYHFARGVIPLGYEPTVEIDGRTHVVREVARRGEEMKPPGRHGERLSVMRWGSGELRLRVEVESPPLSARPAS